MPSNLAKYSGLLEPHQENILSKFLESHNVSKAKIIGLLLEEWEKANYPKFENTDRPVKLSELSAIVNQLIEDKLKSFTLNIPNEVSNQVSNENDRVSNQVSNDNDKVSNQVSNIVSNQISSQAPIVTKEISNNEVNNEVSNSVENGDLVSNEEKIVSSEVSNLVNNKENEVNNEINNLVEKEEIISSEVSTLVDNKETVNSEVSNINPNGEDTNQNNNGVSNLTDNQDEIINNEVTNKVKKQVNNGVSNLSDNQDEIVDCKDADLVHSTITDKNTNLNTNQDTNLEHEEEKDNTNIDIKNRTNHAMAESGEPSSIAEKAEQVDKHEIITPSALEPSPPIKNEEKEEIEEPKTPNIPELEKFFPENAPQSKENNEGINTSEDENTELKIESEGDKIGSYAEAKKIIIEIYSEQEKKNYNAIATSLKGKYYTKRGKIKWNGNQVERALVELGIIKKNKAK